MGPVIGKMRMLSEIFDCIQKVRFSVPEWKGCKYWSVRHMNCPSCHPSHRRQKRGWNRKIKLISQSFNCSFSTCPWMVFKDVAQKGAFIPKDEVYCAKTVVNITCICTSCTGSYVCIVIRLTNIANPSAESILRYESTEGYRCTFQRNAKQTNENY